VWHSSHAVVSNVTAHPVTTITESAATLTHTLATKPGTEPKEGEMAKKISPKKPAAAAKSKKTAATRVSKAKSMSKSTAKSPAKFG